MARRLANFGPMSSTVGPTLAATFAEQFDQLCLVLARSCPNLAEVSPISGKLGRSRVHVGQLRRNLVKLGPKLATSAPHLVQVGPHRAESSRRPDSAELAHISQSTGRGRRGGMRVANWRLAGERWADTGSEGVYWRSGHTVACADSVRRVRWRRVAAREPGK